MEVAIVTAIIITCLTYVILSLKKSLSGKSGCHPGSSDCEGCSCSLKEKFNKDKMTEISRLDQKPTIQDSKESEENLPKE